MLSFFVALAVLGPRYGADSRLDREAASGGRGRDPCLVAGLVSPNRRVWVGQELRSNYWPAVRPPGSRTAMGSGGAAPGIDSVAEEGGDAAEAG